MLNFSHSSFREKILDSTPSAFSLGFISSFSFCVQREKCQLFCNIHVLSCKTSANFMIKNCQHKLCNYIKHLGQSKPKCFITCLDLVLMSDLPSALWSSWTMKVNTRVCSVFLIVMSVHFLLQGN